MCVIEIREKYGRIYTRLFIWITRSGVGMAGEKGEKKKQKIKQKITFQVWKVSSTLLRSKSMVDCFH